MIAVFKTGNKQYLVKAGQILKVEKLEGKKGDNISFDSVLALTDSSNHTIGEPLIKGASVNAKILDQIRDKKIIVFKKKKRKNYRSTHGHRQYLTVLKIESIMHGNKKSTIAIKETKKVGAKSEISKKHTKKIVKKTISKNQPVKKTATKKISKKKITKGKK